jgi:hypothetical protein
LSTFHRDKAKPTVQTDVAYLFTVSNTIDRIRETYLTSVSKSAHKKDIATLTTLIDEIEQTKNRLNRKQLSRYQYNKIRTHLTKTSLQLKQLIAKITTELKKTRQQQSLMSFLQRTKTPLIESDSTEDFRGESD